MAGSDAPRVFITGASSGIGAALAVEFARRHPRAVIGLLARREEALAEVAQAVSAASSGSTTALRLAADVTNSQALSQAAGRFTEQAGVPDVVIANAGISAGTVTGEPGDAGMFRRIVETNLIAMPETFAPFVEGMRGRGTGTLVGIASVAGIRGMPGAGAYSASKAGAIAYLESLRVELRASGVAVVTIAPGYIRTPLTAGNRYPMPFLTDAAVFARQAVDAIAARRSFVVIPWQMRIAAGLLRAMPNPVFDRLFARAPRKACADAPG
ncbi:MAG: SDR family oxidoreductase [Gammaproteobacteria bacterium]